jgi:hypothetical protein
VVGLALSACAGNGGGGPVFADPDKVVFEYGTVADASGTTIADTISQRMADARAEVTGPGDAEVEYQRAFELAFLPIELAAEGPNDLTFMVGPSVYQQLIVNQIAWQGCVTASPELVEYKGCRTVDAENTYDVEGTLTRSGTTLEWDLLQQFDADSGGDWHHLTGKLVVDAGLVTGQARADEMELRVAFTDTADVALMLDGSGCPIAGTLEMKRVYAEKQPDGSPSFWPDQGALLLWSGCGAVTVATAPR